MKIYFAGAESGKFKDLLIEGGINNILMSFFYTRNNIDLEKESKSFNIFIDSGGYSARNSGIDINIEDYAKFLEENKKYITVAANLDVSDWQQANRNQLYLEQFYPILPVFHLQDYQNGRKDMLGELCKKYNYIALGGMVGRTSDRRMDNINFLNFCFKIALKNKIKLHGFGITAIEYLKQYPFYSSDSTTWLSGARYGNILHWDESKFILKNSIHYSNREKFLEYNLDVNLTGEYRDRTVHNMKELLKVESAITRLWSERGIVWDE